ncbi:MAG: hypothetical protein U0289_05080 [Cyclobacteriaceae bacterium]|nr:hypothetical protein [Cyclobacteriaceae bacterium]
MKYVKLNADWNAEPNAPEVKANVRGDNLEIEFFLNPFMFDHINEGEKGLLVFSDCFKYSFNSCNDEGYFRGQYRYEDEILPWGEFYELKHDWEKDFHNDFKVVNDKPDKNGLRHFIFFFRDNTLECIASDFQFIYLKD